MSPEEWSWLEWRPTSETKTNLTAHLDPLHGHRNRREQRRIVVHILHSRCCARSCGFRTQQALELSFYRPQKDAQAMENHDFQNEEQRRKITSRRTLR